MSPIVFDQEKMHEASEILRSVSHQLRMSILSFIKSKGEVNVYDIHTSLKLDQSITSQNLKVLRESDIVFSRREGKMIFYSLNEKKIEQIRKAITKFSELTQDRIRKKKKSLEDPA